MSDVQYFKADAVKELAEKIIRARFAAIKENDIPIKYLFRSEAQTSQDKIVAGRCIKQSDLQHSIHGFRYVIWIAADIWEELDDTQREALVYHELSHIRIEFDDEKQKVKYSTRKHEVEFFIDELETYGAWHDGLRKVVKVSRQLTLFDDKVKKTG